jgi:hypothetical protein
VWLAAELLEDGAGEPRLHRRSPAFEPCIAVVVALVLFRELRRELDAYDECRFLAVNHHGRAMIVVLGEGFTCMGVRIGVIRAGEQTARALAAWSRGALDRPLAAPAELWVAIACDEAILVGAFQRGAGMRRSGPLLRRGSGGAEARVGPGSVHVLLSLDRPDALVACNERQILNRYVRPLLRALTGAGTLAHYFGRDWVSVGGKPAASVGFAHDATTKRTTFEAVVAVRTPYPERARDSFRGRSPTTLEAAAGRAMDPSRIVEAIVNAYGAAYDADLVALETPRFDESSGSGDDPRADPPWSATVEEVIGTIGAGRDDDGRLRLGGDLLVSRDALARLEERVAGLPPGESGTELGRAVDETLAARGVALEGVRSLESVRDVLARALSA